MASLRSITPCDEADWNGEHHCPYMDASGWVDCEYWCGADEPEDDPKIWDEN